MALRDPSPDVRNFVNNVTTAKTIGRGKGVKVKETANKSCWFAVSGQSHSSPAASEQLRQAS